MAKKPVKLVRITVREEDLMHVKDAVHNHADTMDDGGDRATKAAAKRICAALDDAKHKPEVKADYIQQMRKDKNGEDELCYLAVLYVGGDLVKIAEAKQRGSWLTALKDAREAKKRAQKIIDREWAA